FCLDGNLHQFLSDDKGDNICSKCGKPIDYKYNNNDLETLNKSLIDNKKKNQELEEKLSKKELNKIEKQKRYNEKVFNKIKDDYNKIFTVKNKYKYIDDFINELDQIIGGNVKSGEINLKNSLY